ncbi:hypothetical protein [Deinococcus humi]|uniref:Uncharacterized protein n=1 Tax=Deinococcus humi TaxID=662880 RepID=A0A7W8K2P0_9DEIO|nr:hypothetical protein [Deinococcus humi]MBB5366416.1 hypothetical protein [Deinococcus humi]
MTGWNFNFGLGLLEMWMWAAFRFGELFTFRGNAEIKKGLRPASAQGWVEHRLTLATLRLVLPAHACSSVAILKTLLDVLLVTAVPAYDV